MVLTIIIISATLPDLLIVNKKRNCRIVDFALPADHWVKSNEIKNDKYYDLAWEIKKK